MQQLPIYQVLDQIRQALKNQNRVVLQAPPGAGKTTAVPIALLDPPWLDNKRIIMLEPRRLAARNAAARMAFLLNEKVGQTVGYQIRQDHCFSPHTRILVVTEGILTRKLQADPELADTALVIFDEFHERSLHADLSLALCLQSQQILRPDLKILVMSATLNTDAICELLKDEQQPSVPLIQSEGRSYPVDIHYLDKPTGPQRPLISALMQTLKTFIHQHRGNCLVFLPGLKEISQLSEAIDQYIQNQSLEQFLIAPLHGRLNKKQQDLAILPPHEGLRKIVLATNIAETSLTIEGIQCVIDSGLERIQEYSPASAMNGLKTQQISQDSADQRSGRAGRLSAGVCYRLWTAQQQQRLQKHTMAEILHSDLSPLVLELANWGVDNVDQLQWMDTPPESAVNQARELLQQINALDENGRITDWGRDILRLGTHPRLAHMILSSVSLHQPYHACLLASLLTEKDIFQAAAEKDIDIQSRINLLRQMQTTGARNMAGRKLNIPQCKQILQTADDYLKRLHKTCGQKLKDEFDNSLTGVLLACAYPDRIARKRDQQSGCYLLSSGKGAVIPQQFQQTLSEYIVIASLDRKQGAMASADAVIYLAAEISEQQLEDYFPQRIQQTESVSWNNELKRVESRSITRLGQIILQQRETPAENRAIIQQCLIEGIRQNGLNCLNWSKEALHLRQRLAFLHHHIQHNDTLKAQYGDILPDDYSEQALLDRLNEWLQPCLSHESSIRQCEKLNLYTLLMNQLSWQQQQCLNQLVPEKITVPSGSAIPVDYSEPSQAVLAVRLQEVFGLQQTPTILDGQHSLIMHLLSPARRPMQITRDLRSFWQTTYHDVKKELRGKYKKHYWPDDPLNARATSKTRKNM